ncbi:MAG: Calx-beta domain-containing protein [Spirosomataceae bacterium]
MNSLTIITMQNGYPNRAATGSIITGLLFIVMWLNGSSLLAQSFPTPTGFILPPGKTITITYEVDVNTNACPVGTVPASSNITNQSNVSGSNFAPVSTSSTTTPFGALTLGNLVYKDNNKNGLFDAGDAGINGVLLRLYLDNGDGTLTVADGAAIATTTTAGGGLYTFSVCPGSYIVEVAASNFTAGGPLYDNSLMAAFVSSPVGGASDPDNDTDNDDNGDPVAGFGVASAAITLAYDNEPVNDGDTDANTNLSLDFGFKTPITVTINDITLAEGSGGGTTNFNFTVTRSDVSTAFDLTVNTSDGTASGPGDFSSITNSTLSFAANGSNTATVTVVVNADDIVELSETFNVLLTGAPDGVIISDGTGLGTITNDDQAVLSINSVSNAEGNAGTQTYTFSVTADKAVDASYSVNVNTANGTATTGDNDYVSNNATLNFSGTAGESHTFNVTVNGDTKVELNETFTVPLSTVSAGGRNVVISGLSGTGTGTITNDDNATISIDDVSLAEGNAGTTNFTFTVSLSKVVSTAVTVNFTTADGTANAGDYNTNFGIVTFPANGAGQTQTITVQVIGDGVGEANETFFVDLSNIQGSPSVSFANNQGVGTILDDDLSFSIDDVSLAEGNAGTTNMTFHVTRNSTATAETIHFQTADNTASGSDYATQSGTLTFAIGDASEDITIVINGDNVVELNETFFVNLSNASNGNIADAQGVGTITNDDQATFSFSVSNVFQNEGNSGTQLYTFSVTLDNDVDVAASVNVATADNTAFAADNDYVAKSTTLTFSGTAGETQLFNVTVNGDTKVEVFESFQVHLSAPSASGRNVAVSPIWGAGTLVNDDAAVVSISSVSQSEATTPQTFTVSLSHPVDVPVNLTANTSDGTATTADTDYGAVSNGTVTFGANSTTSQTVNVTVTNDNKVEADEVFNLTLSALSASGRNVTFSGGNPTLATTGTILNDDAATVTLSAAATPLQHPEGNSGTTDFVFTATLNNPVQGGFSVAYTTSDGLATIADNDYLDNDGTLTFTGTANEVQTITVKANGDLKVEANEDFVVALGAVSGAPAGVTANTAPLQGLIANDELDWGDAPASYGTLSADNGARHSTSLIFHLGATVDGDLDGQPTALGDGDDTDAEGDDDDGVTLPSVLVLNTTASVTVNASGAGFLNAWVDFNNDGDWNDMGEQIFSNMALVAGDNALSFAVPAGATPSTTFARFRYTTASVGVASWVGLQTTGEVEDYAIQIVNTQFSIDDVSVTEGNAGTTNLTFTISRTVNANACSVDYAISGGTALSGSDYQPFSGGTVHFTAGGALSQTVTVAVNGDQTVELDETILMTLSNAVNGSILDGSGTGTIQNDDAGVITVSNPSVAEGSTGTTTLNFTVNLSQASDANVTVNYTTVDGTATTADNDYVAAANSVTFASGETSKTVSVTVNGDCKAESDETLLLRLSGLNANGRAVTLSGGGGTLDGTGTILNTPLPTASISGNAVVCQGDASPMVSFTGANGTAPYSFTYQINGGSNQTVSTSMGNSVSVAVATNVAGNFVYSLVSVSDVNCSQNQSGSVTVTVKATPTSALTASQYEVCPNTMVTLDAHCSIATATVQWNPGGPTVIPPAAPGSYVYSARCLSEGCLGNESSVEIRTHRILADLKNVGTGLQPKALSGSVKDNLGPTNMIVAPSAPRIWTIVATGCSASESAVFKLTGPVNFQTIDNNPPYALFANVGGDYFGIDHPNYGTGGGFSNGTYTLTMELRSADGVGGPFPRNRVATGSVLATRSLQFTLVNPPRVGVEESAERIWEKSEGVEDWIRLGQNPIESELAVELRGGWGEEVSLSLLSVQGQVLSERQVELASGHHLEVLNVSRLPAGMYVLKAVKGDKTKSFKVVKAQ